MQEVHGFFYKIVMEQYEKCLMELLRQYLKREPIIPDDAKRITIGTNPNWEYDLIAIDGVQVGRITKTFEGATVTVTFKPDKEFESVN
jgi:hypothetical protein